MVETGKARIRLIKSKKENLFNLFKHITQNQMFTLA